MADTPFLRLSERWMLAHDKNQWVLQKRRGAGWFAVSFVGGGKATLLRILHEKHITPTPVADAILAAMPPTFLAWTDRSIDPSVAAKSRGLQKAVRQRRQPPGHPSHQPRPRCA